MRELTHGDRVHARRRNLGRAIEGETAAGFDPDRGRDLVAQGDSGPHVVDGEVVDQDLVGAGVDGGPERREVVDLDLDRHGSLESAHGSVGRGDPASRSDMVVLHERHVEQPHPVVGSTPAPHGVFLQGPQPRERLAGIAHACCRTDELIGPAPSEGGDPGQVAQQVEGGPFGGEHRPSRRINPSYRCAGGDTVAIVGQIVERALGPTHRVDDCGCDGEPCDHASLAGTEGHGTGLPLRDSRHRGDIDTVPEIFGERSCDDSGDLREAEACILQPFLGVSRKRVEVNHVRRRYRRTAAGLDSRRCARIESAWQRAGCFGSGTGCWVIERWLGQPSKAVDPATVAPDHVAVLRVKAAGDRHDGVPRPELVRAVLPPSRDPDSAATDTGRVIDAVLERAVAEHVMDQAAGGDRDAVPRLAPLPDALSVYVVVVVGDTF